MTKPGKHRNGRETAIWVTFIRPPDVGKALSFTRELYFFFSLFYQFTALTSRAVDGHQIYFGDSVLGKASTIGMEISPPLPEFSQGGGGKKCEIITQLWAARV